MRAQSLGWIILLGCLGCSGPSGSIMQEALYLRKDPLSLPVKNIDISVCASAEARSESEIALVTLLDMVKQWSSAYVVAAGGQDQMRLMITQTRVREERLPKKTGVSTYFSVQYGEKYVGDLSLRFERLCPFGKSKTSVNISVSGEKYVPENANVLQRKSLLMALYVDLINRLTLETDKILLEKFGGC